MSTVYLNGTFMPMADAKISPMDRGFLFGDGIYEVIPSYDGKMVGFGPHIDRMIDGLAAIGINCDLDHDQWRALCDGLVSQNDGKNLGIYLHVSRGTDTKRHHAYPSDVPATIFGFAFEIPDANVPDKALIKPYSCSLTEDMRWKRCGIKSTALLGNVMHFQTGYAEGNGETILFNEHNLVTEGSAVNAYIVKDGKVITAPLTEQILPGITRLILLDVLNKHSDIVVEERAPTIEELFDADEVWITSSSKEVAPVTMVDGKQIGDGKVGDVWLAAQTLYTKHKYEY